MLNSSAHTDLVLVSRCQAGDTSAFDPLFKKYHLKLLHMVSSVVHDPADAEDVVQDAFFRAFRAIKSFRGESAFFTWLACIGINSAKYSLQRRKRTASSMWAPNVVSDQKLNPMDERADIVTPEDLYACNELVGLVGVALSEVRREQSTAITLHQVDGLSYEEIAAAMGSPIGTVRSRISEARSTIAKCLQRAER